MKETKTIRTPEGKDVMCIYMNLFGVRVWFEMGDFKRFCRVCLLTAKIERRIGFFRKASKHLYSRFVYCISVPPFLHNITTK